MGRKLLAIGLLLVTVCSVRAWDISPTDCFKFTWLINANSSTVDCRDDRDWPCYTPFIITDEPQYPPNISDLTHHCDGTQCARYTCTPADSETCIRWVIYDTRNKPQYMSLYCGKMIDTTDIDNADKDLKQITNDCFTERNNTEIIEACTCTGQGCNGEGNGLRAALYSTLFLALAVALLSHF